MAESTEKPEESIGPAAGPGSGSWVFRRNLLAGAGIIALVAIAWFAGAYSSSQESTSTVPVQVIEAKLLPPGGGVAATAPTTPTVPAAPAAPAASANAHSGIPAVPAFQPPAAPAAPTPPAASPTAAPPAAAGHGTPGTTQAPRPASTGRGPLAGVDPGLIETRADGALPVIGRDGRQPWQVYSSFFDGRDKRPRIAIILTGLGLATGQTEAALEKLPPGVTLAYSPYSTKLADAMDRGRGTGHESLMLLPMEPNEYPRDDPGPQTLLTGAEPRQNVDRLEWVMGRGTAYVGLVAQKGSRFMASGSDLKPILSAMRARGLLFVDNGAGSPGLASRLASEIGLPRVVVDRVIDANDAPRTVIDKRLAELEELALRSGAAVGLGSLLPATIDRLIAWTNGLADKGFVLAPVSAVVGIGRNAAEQ